MDVRKPIIFATGAATLALELIASRIMTPYFGVSLFIWTGILATTLVCLAIGYHLGGVIGRDARRAGRLFTRAPAAAALALAAATLVYPTLFPGLARTSLAGGSIVASVVLLAPTLILLSAMNPLLIAVLRAERAAAGPHGEAGDSGAGAVFALSTFGSVAGVLLAAYLLIPNLLNLHSVLVVAALLGALTVVAALAPPHGTARPGGRGKEKPRLRRPRAFVLGLAAIAAAAAIGAAQAMSGPGPNAGYAAVAAVPSEFGTLRVVDIAGGTRERLLLVDGMNMGAADADGRPSSAFFHAMNAIALSRGTPERALVLGLGIGGMPMMLAAAGTTVDAVEINGAVVDVARAHFGFDPAAATVFRQDARIFAARCDRPYDAILVDLFTGDGVPEHLVTQEFLGALKQRCLAPDGVIGFNTFEGGTDPAASALIATIVKVFGPAAVFADPVGGSSVRNAYVAAPPPAGPVPDFDQAPSWVRGRLERSFALPRTVTPDDVADLPPLTDAGNLFSYIGFERLMEYRRQIVERLPWPLLLS